MDNASIHNSTRVREIIENAGAQLIYTAPYSPELNPIEYMFGEYKKSLKRLSHSGTIDWLTCHWKALDSVTPRKARAFFSHCKVPLIDDWIRRYESMENGILPEPFDSMFEALYDCL